MSQPIPPGYDPSHASHAYGPPPGGGWAPQGFPPPQAPPPPSKWYHDPAVAILSLFCCWPAGLALVWGSPRLSKGAKLGVTGAWLTLAVVGLALNATAPRPSAVASAPVSTAAAAPTATVERPVRAAPREKPKLEVMAVPIKTLLGEYKSNEVRADARYKDQWVQVTGQVGEVKKDILGSIYVTLGTGAAFEIPQVQAFFDDRFSRRVALLDKGQSVTVRCRVEGLMMNVLAKECELVD